MEQWKEYKLGDICRKVCSGGTPSSKRSEYYDGDIPWLNTKEINFNRIYKTEKCITEEGLKNSSAKWIEANSVIVAMYGATAGKSAITKIPLTTNQACCNLTINSDVADYRYVYYFLCHKFYKLASLANGGAQQNLNAQIIKDFSINLPSLTEQMRIADVLSSLDDKIEVNWRINDNLEKQAQALFKSWFVDFEPFKDGEFVESELGMIPKGWRIEPLCNWGQIICGKTPSKANKNFYNGDIPFIKIPDMHDHVYIIKTEDHLSNTGDESQKNKRIPPYSILVSCIATVGLVAMNTCMAHTNQQINSIIPFYDYTRYYLYQTLGSMSEYIQNLGRGGTATLNVNSRFFGNIKIITPPTDVLKQYSLIISSMFEQIEKNEKTTQSLDSIRDTLLPRLMSGELKPSGITL